MLNAMNLAVDSVEKVPLEMGADGVIRVAGTRVTLDSVAEAFRDGATVEEIFQQYPSVALADVYSILGYILRRSAEMDAYLEKRGARRAEIQQQNETRFPLAGLRNRLARRPRAL